MGSATCEYKVSFYFSFLLSGINFPDNMSEVTKANEQIQKALKLKKAHDIKFEVQCGEHWEDPAVVRRHLWLFSSHIHYGKKVESKDLFDIFSEFGFVNEMRLDISTVFGGVSGAALLVTLINGKSFEMIVNGINNIVGIDTESSFRLNLNKFFMDEIVDYKNSLNEVSTLQYNSDKIKWKEFSDKLIDLTDDKEEMKIYTWITGWSQLNGEKHYKDVIPEKTDDNELTRPFYQEPYVTLMVKSQNSNVSCDKKYFLGEPLTVEGKKIEWADIEFKDKKIQIIANPTRAFVLHNHKGCDEILEKLFPRVIFLLRSRMHFCMLWDTKIQYLYQNLNYILSNIENQNPAGLFDSLKKINKVAHYLSEWSSEIFSSFVWRYSAFLAAEKGYLLTIYNQLDRIMSTTHKTDDLRKSVDELRQEIEFASNIIREKIAEKFPLYLKENKNESKSK